MNHISKILILGSLLAAVLLFGCEKDVELYSYEYDMINFEKDEGMRNEDSIRNFTFYYAEPGVIYDTVWMEVSTMGFLSDKDRPFVLEQVKSHKDDAISGTHYVSFDDPGLQKYYIIPKDSVKNIIPIVLKRDPSLKEKTIRLDVTFGNNGIFRKGLGRKSILRIEFTDQLIKPIYWNDLANHYWGTYGLIKHKFMIENSGFKWNDDFLLNDLLITDYARHDQRYFAHLSADFSAKLSKLNAEREKQGLDPLKEANGIIVEFPFK